MVKKTLAILEIFLDLAKTFDTVNHDELIKILHRFGLKATGLVFTYLHISH